jgi:hypothetical protein
LQRIESAKTAIHIISANPVLGIGFNAYRYAQIKYGFREAQKKAVSHADSGTDSSLLFVMATTGLVGFTFYIYMWTQLIKKIYINKNNNFSINRALILSSLLGIFINSFFINSLFFPPILIWVLVLISINDRG